MTAAAWTLRVVWPIENEALFDAEAIELARADLPDVAARTGAVITGTPVFQVVNCANEEWPATPTAVLCVVPAEPARARHRGTGRVAVSRAALSSTSRKAA